MWSNFIQSPPTLKWLLKYTKLICIMKGFLRTTFLNFIIIMHECWFLKTATDFIIAIIITIVVGARISLLGLQNRVLPTGWLRQQKFIVPQFWRPEIQEQDIKRVGSFWAVRKSLFHASPLPSGDWLAIFGDPWFIEALSQSLPLPSHSVSLCSNFSL